MLGCWSDIGLFCKTFIPDVFRIPYTRLHQKLIDFINDAYAEQRRREMVGLPCGMKNVVIGTRGLAKSSFLLLGVPAREFMFDNCPFYVPITKSLNNSVIWSEALKRALTKNRDLKQFVGRVKPVSDEMRESFGKEFWVGDHTATGASMAVLPLGREQEVRGKNVGGWRVRLAVLDDLEDMEEVRNPDRRELVRKYIRTDVCKAVNLLEEENEPFSIWLSDTVKHTDCAVEYFSKQGDWNTLRVSVCDENYQTLDERHMSQATLDTEVGIARAQGKLHELAQELMARPGVDEYAAFKRDDFRFYKESDPSLDKLAMTTMVIVDPARTDSSTSDDSGFLVVGVDPLLPAIRLRDCESGKFNEEGIVQQAILRVQKYGAQYLGVEFTGLERWGKRPFEDALRANGLYHVTLVPLKSSQGRGFSLPGPEGAKVARLKPFAPYVAWNIVYFNTECPKLAIAEDALTSYPHCANWHVADCMGYILQMMSDLQLSLQTVTFTSPGDARQRGGDPRRYWRARREEGTIEELLENYDGEPLEAEDPLDNIYSFGEAL